MSGQKSTNEKSRKHKITEATIRLSSKQSNHLVFNRCRLQRSSRFFSASPLRGAETQRQEPGGQNGLVSLRFQSTMQCLLKPDRYNHTTRVNNTLT